MLERLGRGAARHHWVVVVTWLVVAVGVAVANAAAGGHTRDVFTIPGSDSQAALDLLDERFPSESDPTATIVFEASTGTLTAPDAQSAIGSTLAEVRKQPAVVTVSDPYQSLGGRAISADGTIATATVSYESGRDDKLPGNPFEALEAASAPARDAGLTVEYGGEVVDLYNQQVSGIAEHADDLGLLVALIILLLAFGSVIAAGLPIGTALLGLGTGISLVYLLSAFTTVGSVAPKLATMIGLGVGIDYSLFIVSRYRQELAGGAPVPDAVGRAMATAGSAVLFAGVTVCIANAGLVLGGIPYVTNMGLTASLVVAIMVVAALTLLPALLGLIGTHIDRLRIPLPHRHRENDPAPTRERGWARWARSVARHPWVFIPLALAILLTLAAPFLRMEPGFDDDGDASTTLTQRRAFDLVSTGFGVGANGPLLVVVALPTPDPASAQADQTAELDAVLGLVATVGKAPGVASVSPPLPSPDATTAVFEVIPTSGPNDEETQETVRNLRATVIPDAVRGTDLRDGDVHVGGLTAELIDLSDRIDQRLPWFIGAVVAASFVLLMMVFRSVLVPLKAAVMNILSIAAAYGVLVAAFQWGWGKDLIGLEQAVPIEAFVPLIMFAVLFGLSMDYEVFLMTRIREQYVRTGDPRESVVSGVELTARVISAAALIMMSVFLSFVFDLSPTVKMIGLGLAVAVLVDATVVRLLLVPALMEVMGHAAWWLPRWLDRILPHLEIDPPEEPRAVTPR